MSTFESPYRVGKKYVFRTVTQCVIGEITAIVGTFAVLKHASWIADTGRYHNFFKSGATAQDLTEIEPYPDCEDEEFGVYSCTVNLASLTDAGPWQHDLPRNQK